MITAKEVMPYTVYFENLPTASSTTREVKVVDTFDTNLDLRTFRLGQIVFNHYTVTVPANRSFYTTQLPLSDQASNLVANITVGVDVFNRAATWTLTAVDLNTGTQPLDPNLGLLPPDTTNGVGQGYVTYTISPVAGLTTGTVITNQAVITFENNAPILTPITTNTLDVVAPTSQVAALPSTVLDTNITVSWSGSDDLNGSGIQSYRIWASDNGGSYSLWFNTDTGIATNVITTSAVYTGYAGHTYKFYSTAVDNVGNVEAAHTNADATVFVSGNHAPVVPAVPDQFVSAGGSLGTRIPIADPGEAGTQLGVSVIGGPPGLTAYVKGTNIIVRWTPGSFQAATTNLVQLVITNNGVPPLTTTQTFLVSIPDYVQATLGTSAARPGEPVCLPMSLFSSAMLTNVQFIVSVPATGLTNWSVTPLSAALCGGSVLSLNATQLLVNLTTCAGQVLLTTNQVVAQLCLNVGTNEPSEFIPIPITVAQAIRNDSSQVNDTGSSRGRLVVVADKPLLDLQTDTNGVVLTLYGIPNATNTVLATPDIGGVLFQPIWQNVISNLVNPISIPMGTNTQRYFRAVVP